MLNRERGVTVVAVCADLRPQRQLVSAVPAMAARGSVIEPAVVEVLVPASGRPGSTPRLLSGVIDA